MHDSFSGHLQGGKLWGLNLALCAVNIGEAAKDALPRWLLAEIYATSALQARDVLPDRMHFLAVISLSFYYKYFFITAHTIHLVVL